MLRETILVFAALLVLVSATEVNPCENGRADQEVREVQITNCNTPPCKLKRRTRVSIEQVFTPSRDVQSLTNTVHAKVFGVPLPFIGVDGTDACGQIFNPDGSQATCPLKKGQEYHYKNSFAVLPIYPLLSVDVIYALTEGSQRDVITCFEVPSKITN